MSETTLRDVLTDPKTYENVADHIPEKEEGKAYALRKLEAKDIAPMASILAKIGLKEFKDCLQNTDVQAIMAGKDDQDAVNAVGMAVMFDIVGGILASYEKAQDDIFKFLASLSGKDKKEIESLSLSEFAEMMIEVVKKEEFRDFIKVVSTLFK